MLTKTLLSAFLLATSLQAVAADPPYPSMPIRLVVPFSAGGPSDVLTRAFAEPLGKVLGQPVIIDNKPGAGTRIAIEYVAAAKPDGYTVLVTGLTYSMLPHLTRLKIDADKDLVPVGQFGVVPQLLVARSDLPVKSVRELIDYAKANPGKVNFASAGGPGSSVHLQAELFQRMSQTKMTHVTYKGSPPALMDMLAGRVDVMFDIYGSSAQYVKEGKLRFLGISPSKRSSLMPDLPTISEAGIPGFDVTAWAGLLAPVGTPPAVIDRLTKALAEVINRADVQAKLRDLGVDPLYAPPAELGQRMKTDSAKWEKLIDSLGLKYSM